MMSDAIEESSPQRNPREGWAKDSQRIAEVSDDVPVSPEFGAGYRELANPHFLPR